MLIRLDGFGEPVATVMSGRGRLAEMVPKGPRYFPRDMRTDQPLEVLLAELVREKALLHTHDEVPHAMALSWQLKTATS